MGPVPDELCLNSRVELWMHGRLEEAAAAMEEGVKAERIAGIWPKDPGPHVILIQLYVAMGKYREAIKKARKTLPLLKPPADPRGHEREAAMIAMYERHNRFSLWAAVADAYESVGMTDKCAEFHNAVMSVCKGGNIGHYPISVLARCGRMLQEKGDLQQAGVQLNYIFAMYLRLLEPHGGLAHLDIKFLAMIPPLRRLVEVGRAYGQGREQDAWALEQELDETEAILAALKASALEELRWEIHIAREEEQGATAGAERGARKERKKPTRKQQKRKAAQRRKAEARTAAHVTAGGGAGGGGGFDEKEEEQGEEESDEVDAVMTAAAGLQLEDAAAVEEPEPGPKPEPEPEPEPKPEPEECAICLNDLEEGTAARLVCTHVFHSGCLERWKDKCLEKGLPYTCAMCRRLVVVAAGGTAAEA